MPLGFEINSLESLPYESPETVPTEELDVVDEEMVASEGKNPEEITKTNETPELPKTSNSDDAEPPIGDDGQATLF